MPQEPQKQARFCHEQAVVDLPKHATAGKSDSLLAQLLTRLEALQTLNPDLAAMARDELLASAAAVEPGAFAEIADFAARLVEQYQASPAKRAEKEVVAEYVSFMEQATRLLAARGELSADAEAASPPPPSVALVHRRFYSSLDWCRLQAGAGIPRNMLLAVDAAQNRNLLVASVLEPMFAVLHRIDSVRAVAWELDYLERQHGRLDADVVRDLLLNWARERELPNPALEWALHWSADENLARQWPAVVDAADLLLRRKALREWARSAESRLAGIVRLRELATTTTPADETLRRWLSASISDIGESVQAFITLSEEMFNPTLRGDQEWRRAALFREVEALAVLFLPVLILSDMTFRVPGGAYRFALAFFGLGRTGQEFWRRRLEAQAAKNIRRMFLLGLRNDVPPLETIRTLCFGDAGLLGQLTLQLDFGTRQFDSMRQRDKVTERLAAHYIGIREPVLLVSEIGRRYRCLMRVMHEDSLARLLDPGQLARVREQPIFPEIMAIATDARRYLARRRDLSISLADMVAAEMDFVRDVRNRRRNLLRRLILGK